MNTELQIYPKLTRREKFFYGFGDLSTALVWNVTITWAMFFFTDIFRISAIAAGTLMLIARIYDAVNDPIAGFIVDRTDTKYGKARPYLLWFAIPYGLVGSFLFYTPHLSDSGKLIYAYVFYFVLITIYTLINIPYNSMIALMTKDQGERTQLSRNRLLFAMVGFIVTSFIPVFANILGRGNSELEIQRSGFFRSALVLGVVAAAGFLITFFNTKEHVVEANRDRKIEIKKHTMGQQLRSLLQNRPWAVATLMTFSSNLRTAVMTAVAVYYSKYYLGRPESFASTILITTFAGAAVGLVVGPMVLKKYGSKKSVMVSSIIALLLSAAILPIGQNTMLLLICMFLIGITQGIPSVAVYPMFGDAVEYGDWKTGIRTEGVTFSSFTFAQKAASGFASFLVGLLLTLFGYNSELIEQSARTVKGIVSMFAVTPIIISAIVVIIVSFYPLTAEKYNNIVLELERRKQSNPNSITP
ncbi:MAG: MFS transporter [Clostridiales bacterium]|nr:MFS transporter [Clostridiales bacterium]